MRGFEPLTPSLPWKCSTPELHWLEDLVLSNLQYIILKRDREIGSNWPCSHNLLINRAGDETRTRDPQLGRLMLYQLSYSRLLRVYVRV
jgi:hypothetical protein